MSKNLDMFEVRILPYNYAGVHGGIEKTYQITVKVNGEEVSAIQHVAADVTPFMTEIEFLNILTQKILAELKQKYEVQ